MGNPDVDPKQCYLDLPPWAKNTMYLCRMSLSTDPIMFLQKTPGQDIDPRTRSPSELHSLVGIWTLIFLLRGQHSSHDAMLAVAIQPWRTQPTSTMLLPAGCSNTCFCSPKLSNRAKDFYINLSRGAVTHGWYHSTSWRIMGIFMPIPTSSQRSLN